MIPIQKKEEAMKLVKVCNDKLTSAEEKKAITILTKLSRNKIPNEIEKLKLDIFDIFDSHFQNEVINYNHKYIHLEDFLQGIYLRFFENLNFVQKGLINSIDFLSEINKIVKPAANERKEKELSLNDYIYHNSKKTFIENCKEEDLPVYASQRSDVEQKIIADKLNIIKSGTVLSEKEEAVFDLKSQGKTFNEIVDIMGKSYTTVKKAFLSAVIKMQQANDVLPLHFENYVKIIQENSLFMGSKTNK